MSAQIMVMVVGMAGMSLFLSSAGGGLWYWWNQRDTDVPRTFTHGGREWVAWTGQMKPATYENDSIIHNTPAISSEAGCKQILNVWKNSKKLTVQGKDVTSIVKDAKFQFKSFDDATKTCTWGMT